MNNGIVESNGFFQNLVSLSTLVEEHSSLDTVLNELTALVAKTLRTSNCSIMLLKEQTDNGQLNLRVQAHHGHLPLEAYSESPSISESIAGKVAKTKKPLLVNDITTLKQHPNHDLPGGFISFPIILGDHVVGVVNVNSPLDEREFGEADLELANILSFFIAKSMQNLHLQNLLKSQFAMAALAKEQSEKVGSKNDFTQEPERVVKILAKSFFNDMKKMGMGNDHILEAATEIIDLLGKTMGNQEKSS